MEKMWAPWRMEYIKQPKEDSGCILCTKPRQSPDNDRDNLILYRGEHSFIIMNRYPYNNGHLMICPYLHTVDMADLDTDAVGEIWRLADQSVKIIRKAFRAEGFNIGINLGRTAGAGIDDHLHVHLVPRWNGDTNFMPVIGETKVISQGIFETYDDLLPFFNNPVTG